MLKDTLRSIAKPVAKKVLNTTLQPSSATKWFYSGVFYADTVARELYEWSRRSLVATPVFLARCEEYGSQIVVDRIPYVTGNARIRLGNNIRFSGKFNILSPNNDDPGLLEIGEGVFIGHGCLITVAKHVKIGKFVSIGSGTQISDTEGHSHYNPDRPIWEVPAGEDDVAPVILEDGAQISKDVTILKGVTIGARSVVGARAVVRSNIPADSVVMGNPARVVKRMGS
ncbi:MAG: hypothetical protein CSA65_09320 [Proteobacteria bacterium]|nr:MAG: hypothetical protein CSA65_09320 [Pseudomonadota bacterium]